MPADHLAGSLDRLLRLALAVAIFVLAPQLVLATGMPALEDASIGELAAAVQNGVLAGDRATAPTEKQKAYRAAHDALRRLQRIAAASEAILNDQRPEDARKAIADLANSGLAGDVLALQDFQWSLATASAALRAPADTVGAMVDLDALVRDIGDPRYRVAAFVDLARLRLPAQARVLRYARLALGEASAIRDDRDRAAAALAVIRLLTDARPEHAAGALLQALLLVPTAAERVKASAELARATLAAEDRSLAPAALAAAAHSLLASAGNPAAAAALALAIPPTDSLYKDAVEEVLAAALNAGDQDVAVRIAIGVPGEATQGKAFRRIVTTAIALGSPLRAIDLPSQISAPRERSLALLDLGKDLAERGYRQIAGQELAGALAAAKAIGDPAERSGVLQKVADAAGAAGLAEIAAATGKTPGAESPGEAAPQPALRGNRLTADDKRIDTARAALAAGDFNQALALAGTLEDHRRAAALVADAAVAEAAAGDLRGALDRIRGLDDYRERVRAFRRIAEKTAARLDTYGALRQPRAAAVATKAVPAAAIQPVELDDTDRLRVFRLDGLTAQDAPPILPDIDLHAADVLAMVPPPAPGVADLSIAQLNRLNTKFLDDAVGALTLDLLFQAQKNINPSYIYLSRGVYTLGQVAASLTNSSGTEITRQGDVVVLRVPLLVGPDATLVLSGAEAREFRLSATTGAFLVNAGRLFITDTALIGYDEAKAAPAASDYQHKNDFRPFITNWSGSHTYIAGAQIVDIGYAAGKRSGVSFSAGPKELISRRSDSKSPTGIVVDSSFEGLLNGFYSFEAGGVSVIGNEYRDNIVYGVDPHDRSKDLRIAYNAAYGSHKKHGIIVSREVDDSVIVGNLSFTNHGSGIMLDRSSVSNLVYANTSIENDQDGVTLFESGCNAILSNDITANRRGGIKLRNSADVSVYRNRIDRNAGAGLEAYVTNLETEKGSALRDFKLDPYRPVTTLAAAWNLIAGNGLGVSLHGANAASFADNTFIHQTPKLYGGDLKSLRVRMLGFAAGEAPVLVSGQCPPPVPSGKACTSRTYGGAPDLPLSLVLKSSSFCLSQAAAAPKETSQ